MLFPTLKEKYPASDSVIFQDWFITSTTLIFSCINGFGSSLLWVGQGIYLTECSDEKSKGLYFAILQAFAMSSQLIGNLLSAFLLGKTDKLTYFTVMGSIAFGASVYLMFM